GGSAPLRREALWVASAAWAAGPGGSERAAGLTARASPARDSSHPALVEYRVPARVDGRTAKVGPGERVSCDVTEDSLDIRATCLGEPSHLRGRMPERAEALTALDLDPGRRLAHEDYFEARGQRADRAGAGGGASG